MMSYEVELAHPVTGTTETIIVNECLDMDDCIKRVTADRPDHDIEFIGVNV